MMLETFIHEAIDDGIRTTVTVAKKLQEGHDDTICAVIMWYVHKQCVHMPGKEWKP